MGCELFVAPTEGFSALLGCFQTNYLKGGGPVAIMKAFLKVSVTGEFRATPGLAGFSAKENDTRKALISPVRDIIKKFPNDFVAIWAAVVMRKRILVVRSIEAIGV